MKKRIWFSIFVVICLTCSFLAFKSYIFSASNISYVLPKSASLAELPFKIKQELSSHFFYLGQGHQTFAFENKNGLVIKFFKTNPPSFLPFGLSQKKKRKQEKIDRLINGYKLCFELDKENSGLLYVHFSLNDKIDEKAIVYDQLGFKHSIDLNRTPFVIQKKGVMTKEILTKAVKNDDKQAFRQLLRKIFDLYHSQLSCGLYDHDHNFILNTGFIKEQAIRLDVGKVVYESSVAHPAFIYLELRKLIDKRLSKWLHKHAKNKTEEFLAIARKELDLFYDKKLTPIK